MAFPKCVHCMWMHRWMCISLFWMKSDCWVNVDLQLKTQGNMRLYLSFAVVCNFIVSCPSWHSSELPYPSSPPKCSSKLPTPQFFVEREQVSKYKSYVCLKTFLKTVFSIAENWIYCLLGSFALQRQYREDSKIWPVQNFYCFFYQF